MPNHTSKCDISATPRHFRGVRDGNRVSRGYRTSTSAAMVAITAAIEDSLSRGEPAGTLVNHQCDIRVVIQDKKTRALALYGLDPATGKLRFFHSIKS